MGLLAGIIEEMDGFSRPPENDRGRSPKRKGGLLADIVAGLEKPKRKGGLLADIIADLEKPNFDPEGGGYDDWSARDIPVDPVGGTLGVDEINEFIQGQAGGDDINTIAGEEQFQFGSEAPYANLMQMSAHIPQLNIPSLSPQDPSSLPVPRDLDSLDIFIESIDPKILQEFSDQGPIGFVEGITDLQGEPLRMIPVVGDIAKFGGLMGLKDAVDRLSRNQYTGPEVRSNPKYKRDPHLFSRPDPDAEPVMVTLSPEEARARDEEVLSEYLLKEAEERIRGRTIGGHIGKGIQALPSFVGTFLATGPGAKIAKLAVERALVTTLKKKIGKPLTKLAVKTGSLLAEGGARTAQAPQIIAAGTVERMLPKGMRLSEEGELLFDEAGEGIWTALAKATGESMIEFSSETVGGHIIPGKMSKALKELFKKIKPNKKVSDLFTKAGYHGFIEELGEESVGDFFRAATGLTTWEEFIQSHSGQSMLIKSGVIAVPTGARVGLSIAVDSNVKKKREKEYSAAFNKLQEHYRGIGITISDAELHAKLQGQEGEGISADNILYGVGENVVGTHKTKAGAKSHQREIRKDGEDRGIPLNVTLVPKGKGQGYEVRVERLDVRAEKPATDEGVPTVKRSVQNEFIQEQEDEGGQVQQDATVVRAEQEEPPGRRSVQTEKTGVAEDAGTPVVEADKAGVEKDAEVGPLSVEEVENSFEGKGVNRVEDISTPGKPQYIVHFRNGNRLRVRTVSEIDPKTNKEALRSQTGSTEIESGKMIAGLFLEGDTEIYDAKNDTTVPVNAVIDLVYTPSEDLLNPDGELTISHEILHAAMAMALSKREMASLIKKYGSEEGAAEAHGKWRLGRELKRADANPLFQKIQDFWEKFLDAFRLGPRHKRVFRGIESGKVFDRKARPRPTRPGQRLSVRQGPLEEIGKPPGSIVGVALANKDLSLRVKGSGKAFLTPNGTIMLDDEEYSVGDKAYLFNNKFFSSPPPEMINEIVDQRKTRIDFLASKPDSLGPEAERKRVIKEGVEESAFVVGGFLHTEGALSPSQKEALRAYEEAGGSLGKTAFAELYGSQAASKLQEEVFGVPQPEIVIDAETKQISSKARPTRPGQRLSVRRLAGRKVAIKEKLYNLQHKKDGKRRKGTEGFDKIARDLSDAEILEMTLAEVRKAVSVTKTIPDSPEAQAVSKAGRAKLGWYINSGEAINIVFGDDAPRFTALLAALSPQTSVTDNLVNALEIWGGWVDAGRPTGRKAIMAVADKYVQTNPENPKGGMMDNWYNNTVRALSLKQPAEALAQYRLSGPKVQSFNVNLRGDLSEVTNDAWMANWSDIDKNLFAGKTTTANPLGHKRGGYLAMNSLVRNAARKMDLEPAEVQETIWSLAYSLYGLADRAGETRTMVELIDQGALTHEVVNSTPSFDVMFRSKRFGGIINKIGLGGKEAELAKIGQGKKLTGPVTDGMTNAEIGHLKKTARRLDKLRARRAAEAVRSEILVNLSAATVKIPGLRKLWAKARRGDERAFTILQEVAGLHLTLLNQKIPSVKVTMVPAMGQYGGKREPSLGVKMDFAERDRAKVLAVLAQFAENFNQEQVHVRTAPGQKRPKVGYVYSDNSFNTMVATFQLNKELTRKELKRILDGSGIESFTIQDKTLTAYYAGKPNDSQAIQKFEDSVEEARKLIGSDANTVDTTVERFWNYGSGSGVTNSYGSIRSKLHPTKADPNNPIAQRLASWLAGWDITPTEMAEKDPARDAIQADLQTEIADLYEAALVNEMSNKDVQKAYEELAKEIAEQYQTMPIKVEIWEGKGQPYKNSKAMRQDVLWNNHLFIFATTKKTFGPEGSFDKNHPLLKKTKHKDINGKPLLVNDLLRAVHDYYAHTMAANEFGPRGEEAAWRNHMLMTKSPWARWALTSETRGQNSWVNFGVGKQQNLEAKAAGKDHVYADQKTFLLPLEFITTGDSQVDANLSELPGSENLTLEPRPSPTKLSVRKRNVKGDVRKVTGQVKDTTPSKLTERQALREILRASEKASRKGFRAGKIDLQANLQQAINFVKANVPTSMQPKILSALKGIQTPRGRKLILMAVNRLQDQFEHREALGRLEKTIRAVTGVKANKIRGEGRQKAQGLLEGLSLKSTSNAVRLRMEAMLRAVEVGDEGSEMISEARIEKVKGRLLEAQRKPIRELTTEGINELNQALIQIIQANKLKNKLILSGVVRNFRDFRERIVNSLRGQKNVRLYRQPKDPDLDPEKGVLRTVLVDGTLGPQEMAERIDMEQGGAMNEIMYDDPKAAERDYLTIKQEAEDLLRTTAESVELDYDGEAIEKLSRVVGGNKHVTINTIKLSSGQTLALTPAEHIFLVLSLRDLDTQEQILNTGIVFKNKDIMKRTVPITIQDIVTIRKALNSKEQAFADSISHWLNSTGKELTAEVFKLAGESRELRDDYFYRVRSKAKTPQKIKLGEVNVIQEVTDAGILKERTGSGAPVVIDDVFLTFYGHVESIAKAHAFAMPIRNMKMILGDPTIKRELTRVYGKQMVQYWVDRLIHISQLHTNRSGAAEQFLNRLLGRFSKAVLGWNPSPRLKQFGGLFPASTELGGGVFTNWAKSFSGKKFETTVKEMEDNSPEFRDRYAKHAVHLTSNLFEDTRPIFGRQNITDKPLNGLQTSDQRILVGLWLSAKEKVKAENPKASEAEILEKTARLTEKIVNMTQNITSTLDMSNFALMAKANPLTKPLALFKSNAERMQNMVRQAVWRYKRSGKSIADARKMAGVLAAVMIGNAGTSLVVTKMLRASFRLLRGSDDDDETIAETVAENTKDLVMENIGNLYVLDKLGDMLDAAFSSKYFWRQGAHGPFAGMTIEGVESAKEIADSVDAFYHDDSFISGPSRGRAKGPILLMRGLMGAAKVTLQLVGLPLFPARLLDAGLTRLTRDVGSSSGRSRRPRRQKQRQRRTRQIRKRRAG